MRRFSRIFSTEDVTAFHRKGLKSPGGNKFHKNMQKPLSSANRKTINNVLKLQSRATLMEKNLQVVGQPQCPLELERG